LALAVLVGTTSPRLALAQGRPAQSSNKVTLTMPVVYATEAHTRVDPKLRSVAKSLQNLRYTGFELLDTHRVSLAAGGKQNINVPGNRKLTVRVLGKDAKRVQLRVQLVGAKGRKLLDTTVKVNRNGTFIVALARYKDGILVLPLTARY
jgi:hypothetical protein